MNPTYLKFVDNIREKNLISSHDKILACVSGGADSMTMVSMLIDYLEGDFSRLEIAHLNHNLRGEDSKRDEDFVRKFCQERGIIFHCLSLDIDDLAKTERLSIEDCGRKYRKKFFLDIVAKRNNFKIALAHNFDDQAETVLMRLVRGTGVDGLKGMKEKDGIIIRPILFLKRNEIEKYIEEHGISFVQDMTNFENEYSRNKYRNLLIPYIEREYNPSIKESLVRLSEIASMETDFRDVYLERIFDTCLFQESYRRVYFYEDRVRKLSKSERLQLVRYAVIRLNGSGYFFEYSHFIEMAKIIDSKPGKEVTINSISISKSFDKILIKKQETNDLKEDIYPAESGHFIINSFRIDLDVPEGISLRIRMRKNGDRILLKGKERKLKDYLIDEKIDRVDRDYLPIIDYGGIILAVGNIYENKEAIENLSIGIEVSGGCAVGYIKVK